MKNMKAVKIILSIVVVLSVAFFATGLIIKETNYTAEIEVDKPLSETFALFNDMSKIKQWVPEYQSVEVVNKNSGITGSVYNIVVEHNGQKVVVKEKILAYVEDEKVTLFLDREGVTETDDYTFKSDGLKTTITLNASYQSKSYILGCILPYFKRTFKGIDKQYLTNFKAFAEKQ